MKLSIIIPEYNAEGLLPNLLACLDKQIQATKHEVEVFIIDDGSKVPFSTDYPWAQVFRKQNEGPGIARNVGLEHMTGDYFTFIDADDMVADNYLEAIFDKIEKEAFDYCYISWKSQPGGWQCQVQLNSVEDKFPGFNLCVWNRVYKTATFGHMRFNPKKLWSEDADFIYRLDEHGKKSFIHDFLYFYKSDTPDSWTKKMMRGEIDYTRIVYNIREVRSDDTALLEEIKKEYEDNEIVLLTDKNGIPELEKYCMIMKYNTPCSGTILRGDKFTGFRQIERPYKTQVLIYVSAEHEIGGIETWTYNFCKHMRKYYDITVLYDALFNQNQMIRLLELVPVIKNTDRIIVCDTAINTRIVKTLPKNIKAKQTIQMSHTCKMELFNQVKVPEGSDRTIFVSEAAARSFDAHDYTVISNLTNPTKCQKALILVSATRSTPEKGGRRMVQLAQSLEKAGIQYIWLYFSTKPLPDATRYMVHMNPTLNILPYFEMADYLVQLSDSEAFGYSMVEAMEVGTAIISTPLDVLPEIGFKDGKHGYIVPFDIKGFDYEKLLKVPTFTYKYDNAKIVKQWREVLGDTKPENKYIPEKLIQVRILKHYKDMALDRNMQVGEFVVMTPDRAHKIIDAGYAEEVKGR